MEKLSMQINRNNLNEAQLNEKNENETQKEKDNLKNVIGKHKMQHLKRRAFSLENKFIIAEYGLTKGIPEEDKEYNADKASVRGRIRQIDMLKKLKDTQRSRLPGAGGQTNLLKEEEDEL